MKVEIIGDANISLRAENDKEREILKRFDKEGVRVGHTGSTTGICSPALADLKAIYVNREEQALIAYAMGKISGLNTNTYGILEQIIELNVRDLDITGEM